MPKKNLIKLKTFHHAGIALTVYRSKTDCIVDINQVKHEGIRGLFSNSVPGNNPKDFCENKNNIIIAPFSTFKHNYGKTWKNEVKITFLHELQHFIDWNFKKAMYGGDATDIEFQHALIHYRSLVFRTFNLPTDFKFLFKK